MFFLDLSPIAFSIGSVQVYWYGIIYAASIFLAWKFSCVLIRNSNEAPSKQEFETFMFSCILACIIGARLGHILFFEFEYYFKHPLEIVMLRKGGLSFHGAVIGLTVVSYRFSLKKGYSLKVIADLLAFSGSIGIFLGRIANFINQELYGIPTGVKWAVVFSRVDPLPRHPTQLYESLTEGFLSFLIMLFFWTVKKIRIGSGVYAFSFLSFYSLSRFFIEYFKEVEVFSYGGFLKISIGQILSISLFLSSFVILCLPEKRR